MVLWETITSFKTDKQELQSNSPSILDLNALYYTQVKFALKIESIDYVLPTQNNIVQKKPLVSNYWFTLFKRTRLDVSAIGRGTRGAHRSCPLGPPSRRCCNF